MLKNKIKKIVLALIIFLAVFAFGFWAGRAQLYFFPNGGQVIVNKEEGKLQEVDFSLFWNVWKELEKNFPDKQKLDRQKMVYGAISGMVNSLGDPYTIFMNPEETAEFEEDVAGSFEGVGMEVGFKDEIPTVIAPLPGTPAEKAGIKSGDRIFKVGDALTTNLSLDEIISLIRGPKGTSVQLTIVREESSEPIIIDIVRDEIKVPTLDLKISEDKIATITLYQFSEESGEDFKKALNECFKEDVKGLIFDLRNNPGGYLHIAIEISEEFIGRGKTLVSEEYANGTKKEYESSNWNPTKLPMVILTNEGSASASEIVAGALRDNNGVKLIGKQTFGKGLVQEVKELKDNSSLKMTVARWLTPSGVCINEKGLSPDIEVDYTKEDFEAGIDPQMEKAKEEIMKIKR
ncbi:MAG: S41 family peptidase [bacterium]